MPRYQPWQARVESDAASTDTTIPGAEVEPTNQPTTGDSREPTRRDSELSLSTQSSFATAAAPMSYLWKGLQSELTLSVQYRIIQPLLGNPCTPNSTMNQSRQTAQQPSLNRVQSDPMYQHSRFTCSSNPTMQDLQSPQYHHCGLLLPHASHVVRSGFQTPAHLQEKPCTWQNRLQCNLLLSHLPQCELKHRTACLSHRIPIKQSPPIRLCNPTEASTLRMMNSMSSNPTQAPSTQVPTTPTMTSQTPAYPTISLITTPPTQTG
jgi:hypothetical protein